MGQRSGASVVAATLLGLLLVGCNGAERERRAAEQRQRAQALAQQQQLSALVSRCRRQQPAVNQQLQRLSNAKAGLDRLSQQSFTPLPRPVAPDPALLERFTRDDQEMEQERYAQELERWRQRNRAERSRWEWQQERRRQELTAQQRQARTALTKLGVAGTAEAQSAWSRCDGAQLKAVTQKAS